MATHPQIGQAISYNTLPALRNASERRKARSGASGEGNGEVLMVETAPFTTSRVWRFA